MAGAAGLRLAAARREAATVPRRALPALLPATIASLFLGRLRRLDYDAFDPRLAAPAPSTALRMGWQVLRGRF
jgi:hypothetical protein